MFAVSFCIHPVQFNLYTAMKLLKFFLLGSLLPLGWGASAQNEPKNSEIELIAQTLTDYIEGTANGDPERVRRAFHPDFNLFTVTEADSLRIRSGKEYIANIKPGEKANRVGRIVSIDYERDAAIAKVEIVIPNWKVFTDYFLLLKYEGSWKIVHKSYTGRPIETKTEKGKN